MNSGVSQLQDLLGIKLEDAWVQRSVHGNVDRDTLLKAFLLSDMAESSAGCLPVDWQKQPQLQGTFVLQLNEVVNIAAPVRDRYKPDAGRRCLKLHLTDGKNTAWAIELSPCGALNCNIAAGCKVILKNPVIHRGCFMLMGACIQCLGGHVQRLEAARQRLLEHWNQPLGCSLLSVQERRTFPQLMQEATQAAWPPCHQMVMQPNVQHQAAMVQQQQHQVASHHAAGPGAILMADTASGVSIPGHHAPGHASAAMAQSHAASGQLQAVRLPAVPGTAVSASAAPATPAAAAHAHPTAPPYPTPPVSGAGVQGAGSGLHQGGSCMLQARQAAHHSQPSGVRQAGRGSGIVYGTVGSAGQPQGPRSSGQATLQYHSRQSTTQHRAAIPSSDRPMTDAVTTANVANFHSPAGTSALMPGKHTYAQPFAPESGGHQAGLCDVIMIDSDDDEPAMMSPGKSQPTVGRNVRASHLPGQAVGAPATVLPGHCVLGRAPCEDLAVLRSSDCNAGAPGQDDSDDEAPLLCRPRKLPGHKHSPSLHCTGPENVGQLNRENRRVLLKNSMAEAADAAISHAEYTLQVPASFHATEMCLFDDQGACKVEFDIVGKINDGCWECDGVIKPEFLSACGLGSGPADFIAATNKFAEINPEQDAYQAPEYQRMDFVLSQLKSYGTLLVERRHGRWHVALPMAAVTSVST